jgi:hypothetical protein
MLLLTLHCVTDWAGNHRGCWLVNHSMLPNTAAAHCCWPPAVTDTLVWAERTGAVLALSLLSASRASLYDCLHDCVPA